MSLPTLRYLGDLARWLGDDGLHQLRTDTSLAAQLVDVYDRVRTRIPKRVFLARWYPPDREGEALRRANLRLSQIRRMLDDVKRDTGVALELVDFGSQVEPVIPIHEGMYDAVKSADIILVDLTGHRPNVCVEAGFALRHHDKRRLIFLFQPEPGAERVCFDLNTYRYEPITDAAQIPEKLGPVVVEILREATTERR